MPLSRSPGQLYESTCSTSSLRAESDRVLISVDAKDNTKKMVVCQGGVTPIASWQGRIHHICCRKKVRAERRLRNIISTIIFQQVFLERP